MDIVDLLKLTVKSKASDLHLSTGNPPLIRVDGDLQVLLKEPLTEQIVSSMIDSIMNDLQRKNYQEQFETDFSYQCKDIARFRVNAFRQERGSAAVFRVIPSAVLSMQELGLPETFNHIASFQQGLILVTGPTGSGKSTTLASILEYINLTRQQHIITIEDPIEYLHHSKKCLINQREVYRDTHSFGKALRSALREDPDIILIGEMRDLETIRLAMTAAETGHLVLATLHTSSAAKTINRIIDIFPGDDKPLIRTILSGALQAVCAQTLLKKKGGGRVAAFEIMICNSAIRNLIREDKIVQIYSSIQTGKQFGMQTLDQDLLRLVKLGTITPELAKETTVNQDASVS